MTVKNTTNMDELLTFFKFLTIIKQYCLSSRLNICFTFLLPLHNVLCKLLKCYEIISTLRQNIKFAFNIEGCFCNIKEDKKKYSQLQDN